MPTAPPRNPIVVANRVRFTVIHRHCIRIEDQPQGQFVDEPSLFAANRVARADDFTFTEKAGMIEIDTGAIRLTYRPDGNPLGPKNLLAKIRHGQRWITWHPGQKNRGNLGGTVATLDCIVGAIPLADGILSRHGWTVLDDSKRHLLIDNWATPRNGDGSDFYLFGYGDDYRAAFAAFAAIAGPVPMPRRYVLGAWYSRYWPYTSADYRAIVKEYKRHGFPLDVMVMDMDWHITDPKDAPGAIVDHRQIWTGYTWDRKLLPDAEKLLKWMHNQGLHVTLNDHPADGVQPHESSYKAFMRDLGADAATKTLVPFDAGDRKYLEAFYRHTHAPLEKAGCDFWWLDWQQFPFTRSMPGLTNLQWLNHFYYAQTRREGLRGQSFSRWGGWGDHRHPIHFSGDASTGWDMLAFEVPFTSTAGNVGCFFWSHDIGGHMGKRNEEAYARWCQFGALSAALRSHSARDAALDRRPWTHPDWACDSMRKSFRLRSQLFPYLYSSVAQSCRETIPLTRPMYLEYSQLEEAYRQPQQYFLGNHLLVAPIAEAGIGPRRLARQTVWFPPGVWFNVFTGERHEGPREQLISAEIDEMPLFARGGAPIAMQPYQPRMGTSPVEHLIVRCWPGSECVATTTQFYEDDGISDDYRQGKSASTALTYRRDGGVIIITIGPAIGTYRGQPKRRRFTIELPETQRTAHAMLDGRVVHSRFDQATRTTVIQISPRSIRKGFTVGVQVRSADPERASAAAFARRCGMKRFANRATVAQLFARVVSENNPDQKMLAMHAAGIGIFTRNESTTGYPAEGNFYVCAPADFAIAPVMHVGCGGKFKTVCLHGERTPLDAKTIRALLVPPKDELIIPPTRVELQGRLTIGGRRIDTRCPMFFTKPYYPFRGNLAPSATATASSALAEQPASAAIDGIVDGLPGDRTREWATNRENVGAWLKLTWKKPVTIGRVLLFDRLVANEHILAGRLEFSDGSVHETGELPASGIVPLEVRFKPRPIRWLRFIITKTSLTSAWIGLTELAVFAR